MKTFKKTLSLILSVCLIASVFAIGAVSVSANYGDELHLTDVKDAVPAADATQTFRFYMPDEWRNAYNDSYNGTDLSSCTAGIYWWDTSYAPKAVYGDDRNDWPGYSISETEEGNPNIYVAKVPADISTVIFNNTVDGGSKREDDPARYDAAVQTFNITAEFYMPNEDPYGLYPEGTTTCDGMIFVCNLKDTEVNEYSGKTTYKGAWFYYYGEGKYGKYKTLEEAQAANEVFENGAWPGGEVVPATEPATTEPTPTQPATKPTPKVTKKPNPAKVTVATKTYKVKKLKKKAQTFKAITVKKAQGKVTYTVTKKNKKLKFSKGKVTVKKGTKKGTYTMKVKVKVAGNSKYKAATFTKTIKVKVKK